MERIRLVALASAPAARQPLAALLRDDPALTVVGEAAADAHGYALVQQERPHLVLLGLSPASPAALAVAADIMADVPTPILAVVEPPSQVAELSAALLARGVLEVVAWPSGSNAAREQADLVARARLIARVPVIRHPRGRRAAAPPAAPAPSPRAAALAAALAPLEVVGIVSSTGGPPALQRVLAELPADFPAAVLVVQHIAPGFADGLAQWLGATCALPLAVAEDDQPVLPGRVLFAADHAHLLVTRQRRVALDGSPPRHHLRPCGDLLLDSLATTYGPRAAAVVLTGMGNDGVEGARAIRAAGGRVLVQDEDSSVVFGMPRAVIEAQAADEVLAPSALGARLRALARRDGARDAN